MFTNMQNDTLISAIKALGELSKKENTFGERVTAMQAGGWNSGMLAVTSDSISQIRQIVAEIALTEKQVMVWEDTSLALKITDPKTKARSDTARGKLVKLVDERIARIRKKMQEIETPKADDTKGDGAKSNSAKPQVRALNIRVLDEIAKLKSATEKDATADAPVLDSKVRVELLAAFNRITDLLKK
jgi:hypothetical protein